MERNILEEIEADFDVHMLQLKEGVHIWPLLREKVYFDHLKRTFNYSAKKRTRDIAKLSKNFFYGLHRLFGLGKYEYLFFENTNKRIWFNDKFYDIYFDAWADRLGRSKGLFVEFASENHYPTAQVHSENIVSDLPFKMASSIVSFFVFPKIQNEDVLMKIVREKNVRIDLRKETKRQLGEYYFYKFLFKLIKPKAVFVLSSFSKVPIVMAAKKNNIKVCEAQHGFIGESHPFYHVKNKRFENSYPDILFSFGEYELKHNDNFIFKRHQIIPIGGLQLEQEKSKKTPKELKEIRDKYRLVFCITLQAIKEDEIIGCTSAFAKSHPDALFFLCPKNHDMDYSRFLGNPSYRLSEHSIYDVLKISDYNLTIFSTTAVEGETMGAKTIFYNADNLSRKYFNVTGLGASVIEEGESLSEKHLSASKKDVQPYYINGYFGNVEKCEIDI